MELETYGEDAVHLVDSVFLLLEKLVLFGCLFVAGFLSALAHKLNKLDSMSYKKKEHLHLLGLSSSEV